MILRLAMQTLGLCLGLAIAPCLCAAEVGQGFPSIEAFVKSVPHGEAALDKGYGDLTGAGRRDWAGAVYSKDPEFGLMRRIVVLTQQADGSYRIAAQGAEVNAGGGTGHYTVEEISVDRGSVFVSWSWSWHGCTGGSTQQIRFYKNQWRVIGAEFNQSAAIVTADGYDTGDSATLSHNLLTGTAVIHFEPIHRKAMTRTLHHKPVVELLDDGFDSGSGWVKEFAYYAGC